MLLNVFFFLRLWTGRAGITWRARAAFRTRSRFVPLTTPTRQPESACLRWRRTSGAAQQLRSSQGQVSFMHNHSAPSVLQRPASVAQRSRTDNWRLLRGTLNHRFLPFQQADMCHMVWKLLIKAMPCNNSCKNIASIQLSFHSGYQKTWADTSLQMKLCQKRIYINCSLLDFYLIKMSRGNSFPKPSCWISVYLLYRPHASLLESWF